MLSLEFLGAADTVTGSRILLTYRGQKWLVDCGLFQGDKTRRDRNWAKFAPAAGDLAGVILTHAHLDHSGYLPRLCREGFKGPVHATHGTADLGTDTDRATVGFAHQNAFDQLAVLQSEQQLLCLIRGNLMANDFE